MIYDIITFCGEREMFDIRYNILKDVVDEFIVVEFDKTFSGKDKPFYGNNFIKRYEKTKYFKVTEEQYNKYMELAKSSPNTQGAEHWKREFCQKEYIKDCIKHLKDDDVCFIGDVDEIWEIDNPFWALRPVKLKLRVYAYYLNNRSSEEFYGTLMARYKYIKDECLNHLRSDKYITDNYRGWHFTSMGGYEAVRKKLESSYTEETYWSLPVQSNLKNNIDNKKDFLGRNFTYERDESEWPQYLKDNKKKYKHLLL